MCLVHWIVSQFASTLPTIEMAQTIEVFVFKDSCNIHIDIHYDEANVYEWDAFGSRKHRST